MAQPDRRVVLIRTAELLNFFSKCGSCGYPAQASTITRVFADGGEKTETIASCALPCGWTRPVPPTLMTKS